MNCFFFLSLLDETIGSESLNGHATSSVTSEEVKVHIESPLTPLEEQATGPVSTEDKTGKTSGSGAFVVCTVTCSLVQA